MPEPRCAIVGAGPVGCLLAVSLAGNGIAVDWLIRNDRRRSAVAELELDWNGRRVAPAADLLRVHAAADSMQLPDWLLVAVKAQDIPQAIAACPQAADTQMLVVANGLVSGGFHLGLLYGGAYLRDNLLQAVAASRLLIGRLPSGAGQGQEIAALLRAPWLVTDVEPEIEIRQWHKLALNCIVNPLTALLDCDNGYLLALSASPLIHGLLAEFNAVAHAQLDARWGYSVADLHAALADLLATTRTNSSSMRQDMHAGRETEIGHLNLAIAALAEEQGLVCPLNALLGRMVFLLSTNRGGL